MKHFIYITIITVVGCCLTSCDKDFSTWKNLNTNWLEDNQQSNHTTLNVTGTGLQYEVFHTGYGAVPKLGSLVCVTYTGWMVDKTIIDSGSSVWMAVENVIPGWQEALGKMKQGSHWKIYVPYTLGYGTDGTETTIGTYKIPPYSTLIFDIELVDVINY
ncbi:MAG: hypothetical protein EOM76_03080 [Sphingobacteriia bacterium]|jgi:FKBP-type peptidyl-prolyl cis-trans isomerase FklB|nr:FKBP-type peptidyl-prolyl cis-trans isomerase [Paludibacteraceae bacterium]NCA79160.1 hypothetical protein [Sphingobacteriia bacterium]